MKAVAHLRALVAYLLHGRRVVVPGEPWSDLGRRLVAVNITNTTSGRRLLP